MTARPQKSHIIEWDRATITDIESKKRTKPFKESDMVYEDQTVNQDEGNYELSHNFAEGKQKVNVYKYYRILIMLDMFV